MTGKFKALSSTKKVLLGVGGFIVLCGLIGSMSPGEPTQTKELIQTASTSKVKDAATDIPSGPVVETKVVEEVIAVPYSSRTVDDPAMPAGQTALAVTGVNGEKIVTYKVTYTDGLETARLTDGERISKAPVDEVRKNGTKVAPKPKAVASAPVTQGNACHSSYTGACVPANASDVDCAGGSGNGPAYVGRVNVVGPDVYDLDRDGNGVGCE